MPSCRRPIRLLLAAAAVAATSWATASSGVAYADGSRVVFSFTDPQIDESSGLVDARAVMYTVNDSGDAARVYAVDKATGNTVKAIAYTTDQVVDVEAIAPGLEDSLWVGDTGDNNAARPSVALYSFDPSAQAQATRYDIAYPDRPQDAETLLVHPRTGRVFVVSKGLLGGTVFGAPASLAEGRINRLEAVGQAQGLVTDGAFFPDGRHLLLRTYTSVSLYSFPGLELQGTAELPRQEQGEGLAIGATGKIFISTEGVESDVEQVRLPAKFQRILAPLQPTPTTDTLPEAEDPASDLQATGMRDGVWVAAGAVLVLVAGAVFLRASRRRSPRRR